MATYVSTDREHNIKVGGSVREIFDAVKEIGDKIKLPKEREVPAEKEGDKPTKVTHVELSVQNLRAELKDAPALEIYKDGNNSKWVAKVHIFH